jgi:hypothetical protein
MAVVKVDRNEAGNACYSACNFDPPSWGIGVQN